MSEKETRKEDIETVWAQVGKEFADTKYFWGEWVYEEQGAKITKELLAQYANLTDLGKPTVFVG